jgi:hypothetical protein
MKIFKNTTCFGLNRPSLGVKRLFIKKIADFMHSCSFVLLSSVCLFHVIFLCACDLKIFIKWQVLKTLLSVLNIDKPHKDWTMKSESEITMCDRMQMYNIL